MITKDRWPDEWWQRWVDAMQPGDFLQDGGEAAKWRESTLYSRKRAMTYFLRFLRQQKAAIPTTGINEAQHRAFVQAWRLQLINERSPQTAGTYLRNLLAVCRALWPDRHWAWLSRMAHVPGADTTLRSKKSKLQPIELILQLGEQLMESAAMQQPAVESALSYRDGLLIALGALRPMRRKNLAEIQLDKHLRKSAKGYSILFSESETKNHQMLEFTVPEMLAPRIDDYLEIHRPILSRPRSTDALWLSWRGGALSGSDVYTIVTRRTREAFGEAINPHLLRDCAATSLVQARPEAAMEASALLGHSRVSTTDRHYLHGQMLPASRNLSDLIGQLVSDQA